MTESRKIDHVVVAVGSLDGAAARYEALGFTLTPRAQHNDNMGTANRLAQFRGHNFIELLEVDRPDTLVEHDFESSPPRFAFGAHNRDFLARRNGMSMLALTGNDNRADQAAFRNAGIDTYATYDFERKATLPDGQQVTVGFGLATATCPDMPQIAFFTCHNKTPEYFWKPAYQDHANGAQRIAAVYIVAEQPDHHANFLSALTGGSVVNIDGGIEVSFGGDALIVLEPGHIADLSAGTHFDLSDGPQFAGFAIECTSPGKAVTPGDDACGVFIEWRPV